MSNEDKRDRVLEGSESVGAGEASEVETLSMEDKIEAAMAKIIIDTVGEGPSEDQADDTEDWDDDESLLDPLDYEDEPEPEISEEDDEDAPEPSDYEDDEDAPEPSDYEDEEDAPKLSDDEDESELDTLDYDEEEDESEYDMDFVPVPQKKKKQLEPIIVEKESSDPRQNSGVKSAKPKPIHYVPVDMEDDIEIPLNTVSAKKKHKGLKVTGIVAAMLVVAAGCAYAGISYYYADKFFQGTTINGIDCSGMTAYEVEQAIAENVGTYTIEVSSRNLAPQTIAGSSIGYQYVSGGEVLDILKKQKPYEWIKGYTEQVTYTTKENIFYDRTKLQEQIKTLDCAKAENQVAPVNAYVAFNSTQFEIVPETEGSKLDIKGAYRILEEAVSQSQPTVDFSANPDAYVKADVTSEDPELKAVADACNNYTKANITHTFGEQSVTLDGSVIRDWLQFDERGQLIRDDASFQQHIADYVANLAEQYDTVGTEREFYTTNGRVVYVWGSAYGWKIDQAAEVAQLTQEIQAGAQVTRDPVYSMTANSHGSSNDFGNTYIEVDMGVQHMYYYQDGALIFDSDFVSGLMTDDRMTPSGVYTLYYKASPATLKGQPGPDGKPEYETPVNFWMPFNGGVGFHDANWQPYFGGDRYLYGGSHGCINLPYGSAAALYDIIQYNVPIICFY